MTLKINIGSLLVLAAAAAFADVVIPPESWNFERKPAAADVRVTDGVLEITQSPACTNAITLRYLCGKAPVEIPRYGEAEFVLESEHDFGGGALLFTGVGWKGRAGTVPIAGGSSDGGRSWSYQRTSLYAGFGRETHPANPRAKVPGGKKTTSVSNLARVWEAVTPRKAMMLRLEIPRNASGETNVVRFYSITLKDRTTDDTWLETSIAFDEYLAAYKPDYSDSSKCLLPPEGNRLDKPFAVVKDGKPAAAIVFLPGDTDGPAAETAAEELKRHVMLITGVELPVVSGLGNVEPATLNKIALGRRNLPSYRSSGWFSNEPYRSVLKRLSGRDGYAIMPNREDPTVLHVFGAKDKGTLNGVYSLLEGNTDIIWARSEENIGTVYTVSSNHLDFTWGKDVVDIPDSEGRGWNGFMKTEWMARNRCNIFNCGGGGDISWMNAKKTRFGVLFTRHLGGHNLLHFLNGAPPDPPDCYGYFACNEAKERTGGNPCFSSEKMLALFTSNVLDCARMAPENTDKIYVNMQDTWKSCMCRNCRAPITLEDGRTVKPTDENFYSTRYFLFMNRVADALAKELPGKGLVTLAYFGSLPAPAVKIHPAITPEWAPYPRANDLVPLFHPDNRILMQHLEDWYALVGPGRMEVYGYHGLGLAFPRPVAEAAAYDFRELNKRTIGVSSEYPDRDKGNIWDYSAMEYWVLTRLMWNPYADVEQLRKHFIRRTYREAAPAVEKFYGAIREKMLKPGVVSGIGCSLGGGTQAYIVGQGLEADLRGYLEEAEETVLHPKAKTLVKRLRARFEAGLDAAKAEAEKKGNPK